MWHVLTVDGVGFNDIQDENSIKNSMKLHCMKIPFVVGPLRFSSSAVVEMKISCSWLCCAPLRLLVLKGRQQSYFSLQQLTSELNLICLCLSGAHITNSYQRGNLWGVYSPTRVRGERRCSALIWLLLILPSAGVTYKPPFMHRLGGSALTWGFPVPSGLGLPKTCDSKAALSQS